MTVPHYVATKVGDHYEMIRQDPQARAVHGASAASGAGLVVYGLARRGVFGWFTALAGAGLIYHGITGRNPMKMIQQLLACEQCGDASEAPSFQHDEKAQAPQLPQDQIEEASMESFPASDAPAHTVSTGDGD